MKKSKILVCFMLIALIAGLLASVPVYEAHAYTYARISLTKTPSATKVLNGTTVSYLYNATNTGYTALTGAIYDDNFGLVGNFVNLQPGGWVGFNVSHVLTHSTYNVATAYGVDQYGSKVTSTASSYVRVYSSWDYCRWWYYRHRTR